MMTEKMLALVERGDWYLRNFKGDAVVHRLVQDLTDAIRSPPLQPADPEERVLAERVTVAILRTLREGGDNLAIFNAVRDAINGHAGVK